MAAPTIVPRLTTLSTCDATTGWSGGALEPDVKMQGTNSLAVAIRNGGTYTFTPATAVNMSAADTHLRMWLFHTFASYLQTKANGGIQLFVTGGGTNYYYVGGSDTHNGAWELFSADLSAPDINGNANLSAITACGFVLVHAAAARNVVNTYWDFLVYGTGYDIYGGTTGDRVKWSDVAIADRGLGYGVVQEQNGVNFINGRITLGDITGTNNLYFDGSNALNVFYDVGEKDTLYKIIGSGTAGGTTDLLMANTVIKSAATRFDFDVSNANLNTTEITGVQFNYAGNITFKAGQTVTGNVFIDCNMITPSTAIFTGNSINEYVGLTGALYINNTTNINNITFNSAGTGHAIYIDTPGTYDFTNFSYSGYGADGTTNAVVYNNSGGLVTINVSGGSNPTYRNGTGASTVVNNTRSKTFTGLPMNCEVRIRQGSYTLAHSQNVTTGFFVYSYAVTDRPAIAQFTAPGYDIPFLSIILDGTDQVFAVQVFNDPSYI